MIRLVVAALVLFFLNGCGDAPKRSEQASDSYIVIGASADPTRNEVTVNIAVEEQASEADVKAAAEVVFGKHKADYQNITVKSFFRSSAQGGLHYGMSTYANGTITHYFNPRAAAQKIPTH